MHSQQRAYKVTKLGKKFFLDNGEFEKYLNQLWSCFCQFVSTVSS